MSLLLRAIGVQIFQAAHQAPSRVTTLAEFHFKFNENPIAVGKLPEGVSKFACDAAALAEGLRERHNLRGGMSLSNGAISHPLTDRVKKSRALD